EDYVEIPNILSAKGDLDFDQKGVENVTIEIDNVVMVEQSGLSGLFHEIDRGHMSPLRGQAEFNSEVVGTANSWQNKWRQSATQIMLLAGYGEAYFPLFLGLIDDCDITSQPDRITVTARNMGKLLTDQRTFMDAKNLFIRDPITFCDRQQADRLTDVARTARAKSTNGSHPARFVLDGDDDTAWVSERHGNSDELEWIEVQVPNARIEDLEIFPGAAGMEMYFSVYATNTRVPGGGRARRTDGTVVGEGWVNEGLGSVPGTSIPFTYQIGTAKEKANRYAIKQGGGGYLVGDDSKVRIWFRRLAQIRVPSIRYHAAVRTLKVFDRKLQQAAKQNHWILVDDVSDIVKVVLQWTGFTDWEVETVGVRLSDKLVFDRQNFLIDIIWKLAEMTSYVFYVKPPDSFDQGNLAKGNVANLSTGVAVFRQNNAMRSSPIDKRYLVRDESLLTGIQPRFTNEPLADSIRVRGRTVAKEKQKNNPNVHPLGADRLRRYQYSYRPVWARSGDFRFGNVRKPVVHYEEQINSVYLAKVTCLLIAFRQALEAATAQAQFPLFPPIYLDHQIVLRDSSSALSTRLWVASRAWEYRGGEQVTFSMTVAGSLLDVPDTKDTVEELRQVLNTRGFDPAPIARGPWTEPRFF
ncbi:MAG: hypothetical protein Q8Q52_03775, partial [Acidimicrobiia bacterium]|nr:hypothetical protein [Acidimicrobiia bacterium]